MILSREQVKEIADTALAAGRSDELFVRVDGARSGHARFAVNQMTQHQDHSDVTVSVTASFGTRTGSASTNRLDGAAVKQLVARAEEAARLAPEDPEHMPVLGKQTYAEVTRAWDADRLTPADKARQVGEVCRAADDKKLLAGGLYSDRESFSGIASSAGLFGYHRQTDRGFSVTARTQDGEGSAKAKQTDVCRSRDLSPMEIARPALDRAVASQKPRRLEPGKYTVVLAPMAWDEILWNLTWAMSARSVDEQRSALYDREKKKSMLGERVLGENITLRTNMDHPELIPSPFDQEGLPRRNVTWFEGGVLKNLFYSRFWAKEKGAEPTAGPSHLVMEGGEHTEDELVKATKRGVYVSNIWYVRMVDPKSITVTGLTRDGTFLIEDGKITQPVNNFRFNDSPLRMLQNAAMLSKPVKSGNRVWPYMQIRDFNFHSISEAI